MSFKKFHPLAVGCVLAVLMSVAPAVLGQVTTTSTQATRDRFRSGVTAKGSGCY